MQIVLCVDVDAKGACPYKGDGDERNGDSTEESSETFLSHDGFGTAPY